MSLATPQHCNFQSIEPMLNYTQSLIERIPSPWASAVKAALVGDAFGVPHEFKDASSIPAKNELHMLMPSSYNKTYSAIPYGTWSDDGSQMLALLDALATGEGKLNCRAFTDNLLAWLHQARYQAGGVVFDCGAQTRQALECLAKGETPSFPDKHCGNGSLMRVLPAAALPDMFGISKRDALHTAMAQSDMTHPQALARVCCALYVQLAWMVQDGQKEMRQCVPHAAQAIKDQQLLTPKETEALDGVVLYGKLNMPTNSGYVVNSLWSALWAVDRSDSLSDTMCNAVSLGSDTDTIACIAAGLALLMYGWDDRSLEWRSQMRWE